MRRILILALMAGALLLVPLALKADTLTENFSVALPTTTLSLTNNFSPTGLAEFNPADGTLTGISISLSGSASWKTEDLLPALAASLLTPSGLPIDVQAIAYLLPGSYTIDLDLSGTLASQYFTGFTGTGDVGYSILDLATLDTGSTISASTALSGTVTYTYTPATAAVPESGTLAQLIPTLVGVLGLGWWAERRRLRAFAR